MDDDIIVRLRVRATIRRQISTRKSVQEGKPDRIADLLDEAADNIERLRKSANPCREIEVNTELAPRGRPWINAEDQDLG